MWKGPCVAFCLSALASAAWHTFSVSLRNNTDFATLSLTLPVLPVMDTQKDFGWETGCRNPAPSVLWGLDYCAEIWVEWPPGAPLLSNCGSLTAFTGQPLHPVHVYPVTGAKVKGGNPPSDYHVIAVIGGIFITFLKCTLWHLTYVSVWWQQYSHVAHFLIQLSSASMLSFCWAWSTIEAGTPNAQATSEILAPGQIPFFRGVLIKS